MDAATLQSRIYSGYAKAAQRIGPTYSLYRSASHLNPIQAPNLVTTLPASFNINGQYTGQTKANQLYWQIIADGAQLHIGDYLVGPATYCVLALDSILPPIGLRCTQTLSFSRPAIDQAAGLQPYPRPEIDTAYATGIPGVLNVKKETGRPVADLPGDNALRTFYSAFFYLPDGVVQERDQATDENGNNYQVISAQFGLFGYEALFELVEA
ncbi:MAG TPA: hypothetical protein VJ846_05200 [Sphingomicrobium sp.]|nr:hypothetical protein [Sphingomicrobium sp.]